ncbi:VOC family protein [Nakamurella lactea]|uniref:VOC family protein n=1 Tax=Nakamurella lactea TaxID=459515 RepID=UPI0004233998|nr:VOC family protein [Nakamurella lactea]
MPGSTESALKFVSVSLDCADPVELATFYAGLLGGRMLWNTADSAGLQVPGLVLVMQRIANYRRPRWPDESIVHLDFTAGDRLEEPEQRAVALGAERVDPQPDPRWRVLLDPAGHPFCITTVTPPPEMLEPAGR